MSSILLLGCGQLGMALAARLLMKQWSVSAIRRHPPTHGVPNGLRFIAADLADEASLQAVANAQYVVYTPSPQTRELRDYEYLYGSVLRKLLTGACSNKSLSLWLQVSSTSVYGQDQGQRVDESSSCEPQSLTAQCILEAEHMVRDQLPERCIELRFSGIYGPDRSYLLRKIVCGEPLRDKHYTNRIHQEDCVGLMEHVLISHAKQGRIINPVLVGTDGAPVTELDIGAWLAQAMGVEMPPALKVDKPSGKQCFSRFRDELGYAFVYPSFEQGYAAEIDRLRAMGPNWLARLSQRW